MSQVRKILKYNLMITLLQLVLIAALLFAIFFIKFNLDKNHGGKSPGDFAIEQKEY